MIMSQAFQPENPLICVTGGAFAGVVLWFLARKTVQLQYPQHVHNFSVARRRHEEQIGDDDAGDAVMQRTEEVYGAEHDDADDQADSQAAQPAESQFTWAGFDDQKPHEDGEQ